MHLQCLKTAMARCLIERLQITMSGIGPSLYKRRALGFIALAPGYSVIN